MLKIWNMANFFHMTDTRVSPQPLQQPPEPHAVTLKMKEARSSVASDNDASHTVQETNRRPSTNEDLKLRITQLCIRS